MALKGQTSRTFLYTTFLLFDISLFVQLIAFSPTGVTRGRYIAPADVSVPVALDTSDVVQTVFVEDTLALDVVQQPEGNANYVSPNQGEVTQFSTVSQYGNVGLLAHNYLSGRSFSNLSVGQEIHLLYSSGRTEVFVITELLRYQALEPKSPFSSFQNVNNEDEILSTGQMFERAYAGDYHLTLQTCIARDGSSSWGRLFILALPKPEQPSLGFHHLQDQVALAAP